MRLEEILCHRQNQLKKRLAEALRKEKYKPVSKDGYLYAPGEVPALLVAHLDTVHRLPVKTICRSDSGDILMSPQGIGGDDRAGVWMVMELIKSHKCHVLFCEDEEVGGVGAHKFIRSGIHPEVNFILEFDRAGSCDAVFYDCDNPEFKEFVCRFGFNEEYGSFSDISVLAPALGIAAVNLSAGYFGAHTLGEYINLPMARANIRKVKRMLDAPSSFFEYVERPRHRVYPGYRGLFRGSDYFQDWEYDFAEQIGGAKRAKSLGNKMDSGQPKPGLRKK